MRESPIRRKLLSVGDAVPDFMAQDQNGKTIRLFDLLKAGPVVLFFYPRDRSRVCTKEACGFRDARALFAGLNAQIVGVSTDSEESHQKFATKHSFGYSLVSDSPGSIRALFGVPMLLGLVPQRTTFVIRSDGKIAGVHRGMMNASAHVRFVDQALRTLPQTST